MLYFRHLYSVVFKEFVSKTLNTSESLISLKHYFQLNDSIHTTPFGDYCEVVIEHTFHVLPLKPRIPIATVYYRNNMNNELMMSSAKKYIEMKVSLKLFTKIRNRVE